MNPNLQKENKMKLTFSNLFRLAGLSAVVAGGMLHRRWDVPSR